MHLAQTAFAAKVKRLSASVMRHCHLIARRDAAVMSMERDEVDMETVWWTIDAEKTKTGLSHRVPLAAPALAIIREMTAALSGDAYSWSFRL